MRGTETRHVSTLVCLSVCLSVVCASVCPAANLSCRKGARRYFGPLTTLLVARNARSC